MKRGSYNIFTGLLLCVLHQVLGEDGLEIGQAHFQSSPDEIKFVTCPWRKGSLSEHFDVTLCCVLHQVLAKRVSTQFGLMGQDGP